MYALADCNNFFVSCERVFRPDLANKPVVVLSNNDGCAISRSNEAKKLGIRMGQPLFEFQNLVKSGKVTLFSSNFLLYGDMSNRIQMILAESAPAIEVYSIDESFLNLDHLEGIDFDVWAKNLSAKCLKWTGIPVSVGVAPTKTLAKIASKLCKAYPKLLGGCYMYRPDDIEKVLRKYPVDDIWGIGRKYSKYFINYYGIKTAYDFYSQSEDWVREKMGIPGVNTWKELHGESRISFDSSLDTSKKQICVSRSFAAEIFDLESLTSQVSLYCAMAVEKLRKQHSVCHAATIFVMTNRFKDIDNWKFDFRIVTFQVATNSTLEINKAVLSTLSALYHDGKGYKKAGVVLSEIEDDTSVQLDLFDEVDHEKQSKLMSVIDSINKKNGHSTISLATESMEGIKMHREHLSPCYTTDWDDILVVKAE